MVRVLIVVRDGLQTGVLTDGEAVEVATVELDADDQPAEGCLGWESAKRDPKELDRLVAACL